MTTRPVSPRRAARHFERAISTRASRRAPAVFDPAKIGVADPTEAAAYVQECVRRRRPLVMDLVARGNVDGAWLAAMGYLYPVQGRRFRFLCTCENAGLIEARAPR